MSPAGFVGGAASSTSAVAGRPPSRLRPLASTADAAAAWRSHARPRRSPLHPATALLFITALVAASTASAKDKGYAVAAIAIPADAQSAPVAVNVSRIAKDVFAADPDISLLDFEKVLDGGDPLWLEKLNAAKEAAKKGKTAMDSVELSVAADAFAEAMVAYEEAVPGLKNMAPVVETLVEQGTVFVLQGDKRSGEQAFLRALTLDPGYRIDKDAANKRVAAAFERAVKEQLHAGQGTLTVYSTTGAAEVWVDGVFRGVAPFTVDVPAGRHYVRVVRDGYVAWGTAVDVKRGAEASVQAALRPTAKLAKLDDLSLRIVREPEYEKPIAELAAALQVDRLVVVVVKDESGSALLTATMVDGVSAKVLAQAKKVFATKDSFFEHDVHNFIDEKIKNGEGSVSTDATPPPGPKPGGGDGTSLLPGAPEQVETPASVIGGWVLVGTGSALAVNSAVFGVISYDLYDGYRNKLPSQLDPKLQAVRGTWLTTSIVTDASWILGAAAIAGGIVALVNGYSEQAAQEEVVHP